MCTFTKRFPGCIIISHTDVLFLLSVTSSKSLCNIFTSFRIWLLLFLIFSSQSINISQNSIIKPLSSCTTASCVYYNTFSLWLTEWTKILLLLFKSHTHNNSREAVYIHILTSMCYVSDCNCVFVYLFCSFSPSLHHGESKYTQYTRTVVVKHVFTKVYYHIAASDSSITQFSLYNLRELH